MPRRRKEAWTNIEGKTALVSGGNRPAGRAMALASAKAGAKAVIDYASLEAGDEETAAEVCEAGVAALLFAPQSGFFTGRAIAPDHQLQHSCSRQATRFWPGDGFHY